MTAPAHLLPPNRGRAEEALAAGVAAQFPLPVPVGDLWNPDTIPAHLLPWLAWALSVDDWDREWPEAVKRAVIAESVEVHRRKGTRAGMHRALVAQGYSGARIVEAWQLPRLGPLAEDGRGTPLGAGWVLGEEGYALGRVRLDGLGAPLGTDWQLGWPGVRWADYWIEIRHAISRRDADALAGRLRTVAPARCRLRSISLAGVRHELGTGVWVLGTDIPLGGIFSYEV